MGRFSRTGLGALFLIISAWPATTDVQAKAVVDSNWDFLGAAVDGSADEWQGEMTYLEGPGVFLGARNDGDHLYLCVQSRDPQVGHRAMARGLTVRLDPKGAKPLKLRFPIGLSDQGGPPPRSEGGDRDARRAAMEQSLDAFLVFVQGSEEPQRIPVDNSFGIELKAGVEGGDFSYELKIPLVASEVHPYAIGVEPGGRITLTVETPQIDRDAMRQMGGGRGGMGRGGMGGGGMGRGGMGGGGMGRRGGMRGKGPDPVERFKFNARIELAVPPPVEGQQESSE